MDAVELCRIGFDQIARMRKRLQRGHGLEGFLIVSPLVKEAAQRKCGNHREGESRIAPEAAQRIAHVLRHRAQPPTGPLLIALLPRPLHAAKFDQRMPARLRRRHPRGYLRRNRLLHMKPEFFVQLALRPPQNQKLQPRPEFPHHACTSGSKPICAVRLWLTRTTRAAAPPSVARPPLFAPESAWPSEPPRPAAVRSLHTRTDRACSRCRAGSSITAPRPAPRPSPEPRPAQRS